MVLPIESSINGRIDFSEDLDYYYIKFEHETEVTIYSSGLTDIYGKIYAKENSSYVLASDYDSGVSNNFEILEFSFDDGKEYILVVGGDDSSTIGSYSINLDLCGCRNNPLTLVMPLIRVYDMFYNMQWKGSSAYSGEFGAATGMWNSTGLVTITNDTWLTINDLLISDVQNNTNVLATYYPLPGIADLLKFNHTKLQYKTSEQVYNIAIHELGHGMGLFDFEMSENPLMTVEETNSNIMTYGSTYPTEFGECDKEAIYWAFLLPGT